MAFDTLEFTLFYPVDSTTVVTEVSDPYKPVANSAIKITFYDNTFVAANYGAYVLTSSGVKLAQELTDKDYVSFTAPASTLGEFIECVQSQTIRNFLVNSTISNKLIKNITTLLVGEGVPLPVYTTPDEGGIQNNELVCMCVLFNGSCGTKLTTTSTSVEQSEN